MKEFGGIILAGGNATRLHPSTKSVNKHLLPIYDKPMIYYSLSILLSSGIEDITIVCKENDIEHFNKVIGEEKYLGVNINFAVQNEPKGLPHAIYNGFQNSNFQNNFVVLGDNFIFGSDFYSKINTDLKNNLKSTIYLKKINKYSQFGVALINEENQIADLIEKPQTKNKNFQVITGLYKFNQLFIEAFENSSPSNRNEYEIVDILKYLNNQSSLEYIEIGRGTSWYDVGTYNDLNSCSNFIREVQNRHKMLVCSPHEIAFNNGFVSEDVFIEFINININTDYGKGLLKSSNY